MPLLDYEKQIFLDTFHDDGLLITAKYVIFLYEILFNDFILLTTVLSTSFRKSFFA